MMRQNLKMKASEYIVTCDDDLYIASQTPEEILNILQMSTRSIAIQIFS